MGQEFIYEDEWLLAVNKPAGILVIPTPRKERHTLTNILNARLENKGVSYRLHPCHRLDRETSGVIIYAKGKGTQKKMMELFRERKVKKTYLALVRGSSLPAQGQINYPILGQSASTRYILVEKRKDFSIIKVMPLTGRTNQIRIHFNRMGWPILGESKYAFRRDFPVKAKRLCLHALDIEFPHPVNGRHMRLEAKLAPDLEDFLEKHP
ncbi:MAG: RluA family pseudouridine synthase [Candidatus Omnitrophota bacterium]